MISVPEKFKTLFKTELGLSDTEFEKLVSCFTNRFVARKQFYLKEGELNTHKCYVVKGCSRNFVLDENGKEKTLFFAFEDWWLGDIEAFITGTFCKQNIQAIEDMELICIPKQDFFTLAGDIPSLNNWFNNIVTRSYFATLNRLMETKTGSPETRYLEMLKKRPDIFQRIPLQYIASYLNIEPQSLSRLRNRLVKK